MTPLVQNVTTFLAIGTVLLQFLSVIIFLFLVLKVESPFFSRFSLLIIFLISLMSMLSSLFYSQFAGFAPCELCWYQRILMYPQALLLLIAYFKKDQKNVATYVLWLSIIGACIAAYHYYGQMFNVGALPCAAPGSTAVSCALVPFVLFGYITIPMMSFTGFLANIFLALFYKKSIKNS